MRTYIITPLLLGRNGARKARSDNLSA